MCPTEVETREAVASRQDGMREMSTYKACGTAFEMIPRVAAGDWILCDGSISNYLRRPHSRQLVAALIALPTIVQYMVLTTETSTTLAPRSQ